MKLALIIIALLILTTSAHARGNRSSGYTGGYSGRYSTYRYSGYRSHYHGRHYPGYAIPGDRTPSNYMVKQPGLQNIDPAHEAAPPGPNITGHPLYRGIDKHGAVKFSDQ